MRKVFPEDFETILVEGGPGSGRRPSGLSQPKAWAKNIKNTKNPREVNRILRKLKLRRFQAKSPYRADDNQTRTYPPKETTKDRLNKLINALKNTPSTVQQIKILKGERDWRKEGSKNAILAVRSSNAASPAAKKATVQWARQWSRQARRVDRVLNRVSKMRTGGWD
jgi:hypothetical protein